MIGIMIFMVAWGVGFISFFFGVAEIIGLWRFWPWVFGSGLRVARETMVLPPPAFGPGSKFETPHGIFNLVDENRCYFRLKISLFRFEFHTPFPIKGSLRWQDGVATFEGRIPVFTTVFLAAWLVGWTDMGIMIGINGLGAGPGFAFGLGFMLLGWAMAVGMCLVSVPFEIRRARKIANECKELLDDMASNRHPE